MRSLVSRVSGVYFGMLNRRTFLNDLTRHEAYLCSHLQEISKRCRISSVLISGIIAGRRTWMDASDAELEKAASYVEKNDAGNRRPKIFSAAHKLSDKESRKIIPKVTTN